MPSPEDKSRIEELKNALYSRNAPDLRSRRKFRISEDDNSVQTSWPRQEESSEEPVLNTEYKDRSMSFLKKFLIASAVFCIIAVGSGAYLFFHGANLISANNIDIQVNGPVSIAGGEVTPFTIKVTNNNNVALKLADMAIEFPAGTTDPNDPTKELKSYKELLGDIPAGGTVSKEVDAILFGEENLQKQIEIAVTYGVQGSTALFTKKKSYDVLINSSPITVTVSSFDEVTSGQEFEFEVNLKSNSKQVLKNVLFKAEYPFGFSYISSDMKPVSGNNLWRIGDIPSGTEKKLIIRGKIQGEDSDTKVFRFTIGAHKSNEPNIIGTQFMTTERSITIEKPFISLSIEMDGDSTSADHVVQFNRSKSIKVKWFNNLPVAVSNAEIRVKLSGSAYDKEYVMPDLGYFNSAANEIVWNQKTISELGTIPAGGSGTVSFTVTPKDKSTAVNHIVDPIVTVTASVSGYRSQETRVPQVVEQVISRNLKVASNVALTGRLVRTVGPFINTGPIPPKVETPTTYTVIWTVDNTSSTATNAEVNATLPAYVKWLNTVSPTTENITYDEKTGTVSWKIGNVETYTYASSKRREVAFQISFSPSANQFNQAPTLVNRAVLKAKDIYTSTDLESVQDPLSTRFSTDPVYKQGNETVVK